jgi:hypothetical protein
MSEVSAQGLAINCEDGGELRLLIAGSVQDLHFERVQIQSLSGISAAFEPLLFGVSDASCLMASAVDDV